MAGTKRLTRLILVAAAIAEQQSAIVKFVEQYANQLIIVPEIGK